MARPESFQDRSFRFALAIIRQYRALVRGTDVPHHLSFQMLRAGTSIGSNLAEAKSASSRRDLIAKNAISLREARECLYWLRLIEADQPQFQSALQPLLKECNELISILVAAIRGLRGI